MAWSRLGLLDSSLADEGVWIDEYAREQAPQCSAQQHNIISRVDGARKRGLVGVEVLEDMREDGGGLGFRGKAFGRFEVSVEL